MTDRPALVLYEDGERLPRGLHGLSPEVVEASQRGRILQGMADAVGEKGYAAVVVADVTSRAQVSRKAFYAHFADKEECFAIAYALASDQHFRLVARAGASEEHWIDRLRAGVGAYLAGLAQTPALARTFLVEVRAAGPRLLDQRLEIHGRYVGFLRALHSAACADGVASGTLPDSVFLALVGGADELAATMIRRGRAAQLPELEPTLMYLTLASLVGAAFARDRLGDMPEVPDLA